MDTLNKSRNQQSFEPSTKATGFPASPCSLVPAPPKSLAVCRELWSVAMGWIHDEMCPVLSWGQFVYRIQMPSMENGVFTFIPFIDRHQKDKQKYENITLYLLMTVIKKQTCGENPPVWTIDYTILLTCSQFIISCPGGNSNQWWFMVPLAHQPCSFPCPRVDSNSSHNSHRDVTRSSKPASIMMGRVGWSYPAGKRSSIWRRTGKSSTQKYWL